MTQTQIQTQILSTVAIPIRPCSCNTVIPTGFQINHEWLKWIPRPFHSKTINDAFRKQNIYYSIQLIIQKYQSRSVTTEHRTTSLRTYSIRGCTCGFSNFDGFSSLRFFPRCKMFCRYIAQCSTRVSSHGVGPWCVTDQ